MTSKLDSRCGAILAAVLGLWGVPAAAQPPAPPPQLSAAAAAPDAGTLPVVSVPKGTAAWTLHAQTTFIEQMHPGIDAPYSGMNSLDPNEEWKHTVSFTLFLGHTLWPGAALYYDPEVTQGEGLSDTLGIAGFPNGEGSRASSVTPQYDTARLFIRQVVNLGGKASRAEDNENQVAQIQDENRLTFTFGKMSATDVLDGNSYSHDPRTQFLNWALVDDGAWDFPADGKGYTGGFTAEWTLPGCTLRYGIFMEPQVANGLPLDDRIDKAYGQAFEWEERYGEGTLPGALRALVFWNQAHMGSYQDALDGTSPPDVTLSREYRSKTGAGLNWEQEVSDGVGLFARAGFNDGHTETWAYTEIDRTVSAGASLGGKRWGRAEDTLGVAAVANGLSPLHREYLAAGGYGFIVGDGRLSYDPEEIAETYYNWAPAKWLTVALDYQFVRNPGYNRDRGPVNVFAVRIHAEY
jgi:high affinity Mn2+ porin